MSFADVSGVAPRAVTGVAQRPLAIGVDQRLVAVHVEEEDTRQVVPADPRGAVPNDCDVATGHDAVARLADAPLGGSL